MKIELKKLSENYGPDPNITEPSIVINGNNLKLTFPLNHYYFKSFKEGQKGSIEFHNVKAFRSGSPNDEGFYLKDNSLWNKENVGEIDWHNFYEVANAPKEYLDTFYSVSDLDGNFKHYAFFMKEGTFECLAESFKEII